jgi:hypothetical protein
MSYRIVTDSRWSDGEETHGAVLVSSDPFPGYRNLTFPTTDSIKFYPLRKSWPVTYVNTIWKIWILWKIASHNDFFPRRFEKSTSSLKYHNLDRLTTTEPDDSYRSRTMVRIYGFPIDKNKCRVHKPPRLIKRFKISDHCRDQFQCFRSNIIFAFRLHKSERKLCMVGGINKNNKSQSSTAQWRNVIHHII